MREHLLVAIHYDRALALSPAYARALSGRGNAYFRQDEFARAIQDLDAAL